MANKVSTHGDVYSYGILLLEMITGIRLTDESLKEGPNLHRLVEMALPSKVMDITDPYLLDCEHGDWREKAQEFLVSIIRIGLSCSKELPKERMMTKHVIREMQSIKDRFAGPGIGDKKSQKDIIEDEGPSYVGHQEEFEFSK